MTSERRKSILILSATLLVGIVLGLLVPGFFYKLGRHDHGGHGRRGDGPMEHKKDWFVSTIYRVAQPDSAQAKQIKPITHWAAQEIERIETTANHEMSVVLDSVKIQLKPILTDEQRKRLEEFESNAKSHWKGRRGHH
ncbi:MAG TPA: hypothetical protein VL443_26370 [Cyclobacteriaceae bacterium]|jgi:Spy/CpxP family protein refolding chaperone|nr:hypothetical protein [Cyclobacteriaceae bacterium]